MAGANHALAKEIYGPCHACSFDRVPPKFFKFIEILLTKFKAQFTQDVMGKLPVFKNRGGLSKYW
jgi:hypothetical protein